MRSLGMTLAVAFKPRKSIPKQSSVASATSETSKIAGNQMVNERSAANVKDSLLIA